MKALTKIYLFVLFTSLIVLSSSCSSDDDDSLTSIDRNLFTGRWYPVNFEVNGNFVSYPFDGNRRCSRDYVDILADGSYRVVLGLCSGEVRQASSYELNGNMYTIMGTGTLKYTIESLTSSFLSVRSRYDLDGDGRDDDVIENYER